MKYYTIHEFSKLVGKTPQTLRNWDKKDILKPHHTSTNGYRYYKEKKCGYWQLKEVTPPSIVHENRRRVNARSARVFITVKFIQGAGSFCVGQGYS